MSRKWLLAGALFVAGCGADKTEQLVAAQSTTTTAAPTTTTATTTTSTTSTTTTTRPAPTTKRFVVGDKIVSTKSGSTEVLYSHQVHSYEQPVASTDRFTTPDAGMEYGLADVEICAGIEKVGTNPLGWNAQTPDNRRYRSSFDTLRKPTLSSTDIGPGGGCVRGWVTFELPIGQRPASLVLDYPGLVITHWFVP